MSSHEIVGIDVAARKLVVIGERLALAEYDNTAAGRSKLVNALSRSPQPVRVVLEATGMYFLDLACELAAAGIAVMVVNPKPAPGNEQGAAVLVIGELSVLPPMTARQWVAQAGLDVREETSGSSLARRPRLSKRGNKRLREALFYPADRGAVLPSGRRPLFPARGRLCRSAGRPWQDPAASDRRADAQIVARPACDVA
jgi:transposase